MGSAFIVVWGLLLAPIAFLMGVALSYFVPFLYCRIKHRPTTESKQIGCLTRGALALLFAIAIDVGICLCGILVVVARSNNYWECSGSGDYWRMPLEPPYELEMFNSLDEAGISEWKSNKSILGGVSQYAKQGHYVAGRYTNPFQGKNESGYFIFDFETGVLQKFDQEGVFNKACKDFGLTSPVTLKSVKDNWNLYWDDPNRRRK